MLNFILTLVNYIIVWNQRTLYLPKFLKLSFVYNNNLKFSVAFMRLQVWTLSNNLNWQHKCQKYPLFLVANQKWGSF